MSVQDYMSASKIGKRAYHACVNKGRYPYLPVLENIVDESDIEAEVSLGIDQIPLRLVVGTCNAGRTMPLQIILCRFWIGERNFQQNGRA